jgi:ABC-2 type transport system ATP-binding protein
VKGRVADRRVRCTTALSLAAVRAIPGVESARRVEDPEPSAGRAATELLTSAAESVVRELLARDPSLSALEVTGAALEDAFLAVTSDAAEAAA